MSCAILITSFESTSPTRDLVRLSKARVTSPPNSPSASCSTNSRTTSRANALAGDWPQRLGRRRQTLAHRHGSLWRPRRIKTGGQQTVTLNGKSACARPPARAGRAQPFPTRPFSPRCVRTPSIYFRYEKTIPSLVMVNVLPLILPVVMPAPSHCMVSSAPWRV